MAFVAAAPPAIPDAAPELFANRASAGNGPPNAAAAPKPCRNLRRDTMLLLPRFLVVVKAKASAKSLRSNYPDRVQNALTR
ncbi:hypothetical protein GCM10010981_19170 [Dyella nitratireducens]|uniref:Uncharacterized protein n=1 Tax=Dyella nitratireducens TaxID=1849580 RepID=A0ABQ1FUG0_9GAMM|nr:hypothetical protein GCM10010981_19170 [Dyella nitratireducens]